MKIERKYMAHYLNATFAADDGTASYVRLGKDLEEYSPELSANVEKKTNILGNETVSIDSYQKQGEVSPYYAEKGDPLFEKLQSIIDNDLVLTDHTPGYGSAAKYVASTVREIAIDASVYDNKPSVTIVEIMGRHAGWLTAASVLARKFKGDNPVLIYLPEVAFSPDAFIEKVKEKLTKTSNLVVCISEGINDGNGTFVCELASDVGTDTFGHKMLTGSGKYLENLVKEKLGIKVRSVELNVCQRCSSSCLSATDLDEAAASGRFAVSAALDGETGKMINFIRKSDDPYILEFGTADVNEICNKEKAVPEESGTLSYRRRSLLLFCPI